MGLASVLAWEPQKKDSIQMNPPFKQISPIGLLLLHHSLCCRMSESALTEVAKILSSVTVDNIIFEKEIVSLNTNSTVMEALQALTK